MKKFLFLFLMVMPLMVSCGSDDDPEVESSEIQGVWECTSCEVVSIAGLNGLGLPQMVIDVIKGQIEDQMVGERITITSEAKVNGNIIVFPDSNIRWKVLSLTDTTMEVEYDTSSSAGGYGMNMTVKAQYKKVR